MKRFTTILGFLLAFAIAISAQTTIQVSNLPTNTTLSGNDLLLVTKASGSLRSRKMTIDSFSANLKDKGGAVFNAAGYASIQQAVDAAVTAGKPSVLLPPGTYHITSHITLGNGTSTTLSTMQGISLIGVSGGMALGETGQADHTSGLVSIVADSAMDEMVLINGPISGVRIENIHFDCNALAQTAIRSVHARRSTYRNIEAREFTGTGFVLTAYGSHALSVEGGVGQILDNVRLKSTQTNAVGFDFGVSSFTVMDVAQVHGTNLIAQVTGSGSTGVIFRGIDSSTFSFLDTRGATTSVRVIPPTGNAYLPDVINIYNAALESVGGTGTLTVTGTWTPAGGGIYCSPFSVIDAEQWPSDSRIWGLSNDKKFHGSLTWHDPQTFQRNVLGTTPADSLLIDNTTAAAAGAQQISPSIHWSGRGWKTDATAESRPVDIQAYLVPVQGAANPTGYLTFQASVNGGAYGEILRVGTTATGGGTVGINLGAATQLKILDVHVTESGQVNSVMNLQNNATANGTGTGILFSSLNASSAQKYMGGISAQTLDNTAAAEQGRLNLRVMKAGTLDTPATLDATDGFRLVAGYPLTLTTSASTPADPIADLQARIYVKGGLLIVEYNEGGTKHWKYLTLTGTSAGWNYSGTAP